MKPVYIYRWGNNKVRSRFKGRRCQVVARLAMGSALMKFVDNGELLVSSRQALRRAVR